jgi:hypothetical protein
MESDVGQQHAEFFTTRLSCPHVPSRAGVSRRLEMPRNCQMVPCIDPAHRLPRTHVRHERCGRARISGLNVRDLVVRLAEQVAPSDYQDRFARGTASCFVYMF